MKIKNIFKRNGQRNQQRQQQQQSSPQDKLKALSRTALAYGHLATAFTAACAKLGAQALNALHTWLDSHLYGWKYFSAACGREASILVVAVAFFLTVHAFDALATAALNTASRIARPAVRALFGIFGFVDKATVNVYHVVFDRELSPHELLDGIDSSKFEIERRFHAFVQRFSQAWLELLDAVDPFVWRWTDELVAAWKNIAETLGVERWELSKVKIDPHDVIDKLRAIWNERVAPLLV